MCSGTTKVLSKFKFASVLLRNYNFPCTVYQKVKPHEWPHYDQFLNVASGWIKHFRGLL
jgi:hypothetical protein